MALDSTDPFIDWERRANGKTHQLVHGQHFDRDPRLVRKAAGMWAMRHGYRCLSELADGVVTVRFIPKGSKV